MSNPYTFYIGNLTVVVYAPTKDEARKIFLESKNEFVAKVRADAIDEFKPFMKWLLTILTDEQLNQTIDKLKQLKENR